MSEKIIQQKATQVAALVDQLRGCKSFLVYEYMGFTAKEVSDLRADLRQKGCKMCVYKNNILNRALQTSGLYPEAKLVGPNALVLGAEEIEPLKNIAKMADKKTFIKLKVAYIDGTLILGENLKNFAILPTKKDLYAMFCQCLHAPLRKLMYVIEQVGTTK